jgi:hypothetical protein
MCCSNFEVMALDELGGDEGFGQPGDPSTDPSVPHEPGTGANPDLDCDGDTDSDSDSGSDADIDVELPWDTAEDGFGDLARVCSVSAFGGQWIWVADAVALADGSIAVAGGFLGSAIFGRGEDNETELEPALGGGHVDGFLARFDQDGSLRWAIRIGAVLVDEPPIAAVGVTPSGDLAITGAFSGTALLGDVEPDQPALEASGAVDMYVALVSGEGKPIWAATAGGSSVARGQGLGVLPDGSIAVAGHYADSIVLGEDQPHETELPSHSGLQLFTARYAPDGQLVWATTADGEHAAAEIPCSGEGHTLVGAFSSEAIHVSSLDAEGGLAWQVVGSGGGPRYDATALDDGSFALAGGFSGWLELPGQDGPIELGESCPLDVDGPCPPALFTARIDQHGSVDWAAASTAAPGDSALGAGVAELADGSLLAVGTFDGAVGFGDGELEDTWLKSSWAAEPFAAVYGAEGELQLVQRLGAAWHDADAASVVAGDDGGFAVAGTFEGPAQLIGPDDEPIDLEPLGQRDGYLIRVCP